MSDVTRLSGGKGHNVIEGRQLVVQLFDNEALPGGNLVVGILHLSDVPHYAGTRMGDGRVAVEVGDDLTIIGTEAEMRSFAYTVLSMVDVKAEVA